MNTHFAIKLSLITPVINGRQPVDGIAAAILTRRLDGDYERAHKEIPFALESGVLCCSAPIFESFADPLFNSKKALEGEKAKQGIFYGGIQGFAAKLDPSDIDTALVKPNSAKVRRAKREDELTDKERIKFEKTGVMPELSENTKWTYGASRVRECGNVLSFYQTMIVQNVWYFGITNNGDLLEQLIYEIEFLGKKGSVGFGQVDKSKTAVYLDTGKVNGIVDAAGNPLRPVPVSSGIKVAKNSVIADVGYQPAYWNIANRAQCYVPAEQCITKTFEQIEEML